MDTPASVAVRTAFGTRDIAQRVVEFLPSEVATDPRLEATATDVQAPRPADLVERQKLHDALRDVTRAEGGADCDRWGVHFVFCCCAYAIVILFAHRRTVTLRRRTAPPACRESTDGPQRVPGPSTSRFAIVCFSLWESLFCDQPCLDE